MTDKQINDFAVSKQTSLTSAMQKIDNNANGIVFVVDDSLHLCGAVSDGDIRRWLLKSGSIDAKVCQLMNNNPIFVQTNEINNATNVMEKKCIRALPVVDKDGIIIDVCLAKKDNGTLNNKENMLENVAVVIMAGGMGTRLYPYTKILPKPLIPIGEIPIVERVINCFNDYGVKDFFMTVNYKKRMIQSYFDDIQKGYNIEYVEEEKPLGTGGSIKLIKRKFEQPLFVANCDSLIRTDYAKLYDYHISTGNMITIVTSLKNNTIPYGVVYSKEDGELDHMVEKPTTSFLINTGMYVINPEMIDLIPSDTMFHMTHLVDNAKELGYKVGIYPISEDSFLDMGEFAEMKRMEEKLDVK